MNRGCHGDNVVISVCVGGVESVSVELVADLLL